MRGERNNRMKEIIALCAPWLLLIICAVACCLLFVKKWAWSIGLLLTAVVGNLYFECVPINMCCPGNDENECLTVFSFNCNLSTKSDDYYDRINSVIETFERQDPAVVFLTEYYYLYYDTIRRRIVEDYPYYTKRNNSSGNKLYSKCEILSDTIYTNKSNPYTITYCTLMCREKMLDVFGVHLSSNNYNVHMKYMTPDSVESTDHAKSYLNNVIATSINRLEQTGLIVHIIDSIRNANGPRSTIVMGDFNDVCGSPTLNILERAGFKDAWWEGGFGYGATIHKPLPYRIDHIMYNEGLKLKSMKKIDAEGLSDHDALAAQFYFE